MKEVCAGVEKNYKDLKQLRSSQEFARQIKVRKRPVAQL